MPRLSHYPCWWCGGGLAFDKEGKLSFVQLENELHQVVKVHKKCERPTRLHLRKITARPDEEEPR